MLVLNILPTCFANITNSKEDRLIAYCFRHHGVITADTRDSSGASRYHSCGANFQAKLKPGKAAPWRPRDQQKVWGYKYLPGLDGISTQSVAFHLKEDKHSTGILERFYRFHAIIYSLCKF